MKTVLMAGALLATSLLTIAPKSKAPNSPPVEITVTADEGASGASSELRANYLITTADDFIVDVYVNGRPVPDARRQLLEERHGATVEKIDTPVRAGDWVVFNVVNNRLRWGGAYYFGVAGCLAPNQFGFTSRLDDGKWSVCDRHEDVDKFISERGYLSDRPAQQITQPWEEGDLDMRRYAGEHWNGTGVWGNSRNTWVKVLVD